MEFSKNFIRNNIFDESVDLCLYSQHEYNGSNTDKMWDAFTLDYNCYYQSSKQKLVIRWRGLVAKGGADFFINDLQAYQQLTGKEPHSIFADPMMNTNSTLKSNSPAIDAGVKVGYPFKGTAPDMGAFEFNSDNQKSN